MRAVQRRLAVAAMLLWPATGQEPQRSVASWMEQPEARERLAAATAAVLDGGAAALQWLGGELVAATDEAATRTKLLRELGQEVVLGFVNRARKSELVYAGQYADLSALEPFASRLLLRLLLQTPDWFRDTQRIWLVPPLRDLLPRPPALPQLLAVIDLTQNKEIEPADLRLELACLLWQWGRREFVEPELQRLRQSSAEGDAEDRLLAMRQLAQLHYKLRDYQKASSAHVQLAAMAGRGRLPLSPAEWYWGACYHALAGRIDQAFEALSQCVELLASPDLDRSLRLPKRLFDEDPELAVLRADARFAALMRRAFPPERAGGDGR